MSMNDDMSVTSYFEAELSDLERVRDTRTEGIDYNRDNLRQVRAASNKN
jgi:hypothetical protein